VAGELPRVLVVPGHHAWSRVRALARAPSCRTQRGCKEQRRAWTGGSGGKRGVRGGCRQAPAWHCCRGGVGRRGVLHAACGEHEARGQGRPAGAWSGRGRGRQPYNGRAPAPGGGGASNGGGCQDGRCAAIDPALSCGDADEWSISRGGGCKVQTRYTSVSHNRSPRSAEKRISACGGQFNAGNSRSGAVLGWAAQSVPGAIGRVTRLAASGHMLTASSPSASANQSHLARSARRPRPTPSTSPLPHPREPVLCGKPG